MDDARRTELSWSGWGDPEQATELPDGVAELLRTGLGVTAPTPVPASISSLDLSPVRLAPDTAEALVSIVGPDYGHFDHETRARHALGRSLFDLLALRSIRTIEAPDLILCPGSHDEVQAVLELCSARRVAVVPFGGGTSVVGGLSPEADAFEGLVAIDLRRLDQLVALDRESRTATLGAGLRGPEAEALLGRHGFTIGHFPQSYEYATLGGFAAVRSSGQASAGYGRFDELVLALKVATPVGTLTLGRAPKSAAGPDLRQLILGSEGAFGVITELTVQVRPAPSTASTRAGDWPTSRPGSPRSSAWPRTARHRPWCDCPTRPKRRSDWPSRASWAPRAHRAVWPSSAGRAAWRTCAGGASSVWRSSREAGAAPVEGAGEGWEHGRYRGPYLRDALLDAGALVETLETAAFWSSLPRAVCGPRQRSARCPDRPGHAARDPVPRLACVSGRRLAVLHGHLRAAPRSRRAVAPRQGRGHRGDPDRGGIDHPSSRRGSRPPALAGRRDRRAGRSGAGGGEAGARSLSDSQSGDTCQPGPGFGSLPLGA